MPNCLLIVQKHSSLRGSVKISASWSCVLTNPLVISPFWKWCLLKWCLSSIFFALECWTWFLLKLMALMLSQYSTSSNLDQNLVKFTSDFGHNNTQNYVFNFCCWQTTKFCFLLNHETRHDRIWQCTLCAQRRSQEFLYGRA